MPSITELGNTKGESTFSSSTQRAPEAAQQKLNDSIGFYSGLRTQRALARDWDVAVVLLDPIEGVTEQDERIVGLAHEGKGQRNCIGL